MRLLRLEGFSSRLEPRLIRFHRSCWRSLSSVAAILDSRAVLEISGIDAKSLMQGLMTNDISILDADADGAINNPPCISTVFLGSKRLCSEDNYVFSSRSLEQGVVHVALFWGRLAGASYGRLVGGRVLGDAIVTKNPRDDAIKNPGYLMDCPLSVVEDLKKHLKIYKLRSKVKIKDATGLYDVLVTGVHDPWQGPTGNPGDGNQSSSSSSVAAAAIRHPDSDGDVGLPGPFQDPRSAKLGLRFIRPKDGNDLEKDGATWAGVGDQIVSEERYNALRMAHGVGEGSELVNSIPHESNLDLMGSISFTKGCYLGQELTARTQFKGYVRKRLLPVMFPTAEELIEWGSEGSLGFEPPAPGTKILKGGSGDGEKKVGTLVAVSSEYNVGLALLRLSNVIDDALQGGDDHAAAVESVDSLVVEASPGHGEHRRCVQMLPAWWMKSLDLATGKVPA